MRPVKLTPQTCRAARSLLGLNQAKLAAASGVAYVTVSHYEAGRSNPSLRTLLNIQQALEDCGVELLGVEDGRAGVRMREAVSATARGE